MPKRRKKQRTPASGLSLQAQVNKAGQGDLFTRFPPQTFESKKRKKPRTQKDQPDDETEPPGSA